MATSFVPCDVSVLSTRTLIYTCPASTQAVIFAGTMANIDNAYMLDHWVTIEIQKNDASFIPIVNKAPVTFGGSLSMSKIAMITGEKVYLTADSASSIVARLSIVERA